MKVLITGVSSGIGRELAKELIRQGHSVWGMARRSPNLEELKKELRSDSFFYSVCDVSLPADVENVAEELFQKNFLPDIVVLNAGVFLEDLAGQLDYKAYQRAFSVNLFGAVTFVNKFTDEFIKRGSGQFIAVLSMSAFRPDPLRAGYSASKAALAMTFRSLGLRYHKDGLIFKTVFLGPVATDMSVHVKRDNSGKIISKRFFVAEPKDAARFIAKCFSQKKQEFFFPYLPTLFFRLLSILPDRLFATVSSMLKK